jgi:putative oxidoreductase
VLAPILIIIGLYTRVGALLAIFNMLFAFGLMHMGELFSLTKSGGWALELQGFFLFTSLALLLMGAGRMSLGGAHGRWN